MHKFLTTAQKYKKITNSILLFTNNLILKTILIKKKIYERKNYPERRQIVQKREKIIQPLKSV